MDQWAQQVMNALFAARDASEIEQGWSDRAMRKSFQGSTDSTVVESDCQRNSCTSQYSEQKVNGLTLKYKSKRVMAMIAGICQQTLCWGMVMTFGAILAFYTRHLLPKTSKTALAICGALPSFFILGMSLLWGRLLDAGHHRKTNIFAGICLTSGLTGLAFTGGSGDYGDGQYWQILLASVPIGIGQSVYFLAAPHMAKTWYPKRKGLAMGITNSGAAIGGSLWPLIFTHATAKHSFKAGIGALAAISAFLAAFIAYAAVPAPDFERRPVGPALKVRTWLPTRGFRSVTFLLHIAAMCCVYLAILTIPFFIEYWAQCNGIGVSEDTQGGMGVNDGDGPLTVYLVVIMNACQLPGRLLGSTLCDKFQARRIHAVSCVVAILIVGPAWIRTNTFVQGCIFAALFGLTLGIMVSLPINDAADVLGPSRTHLLGQYAGVVYTIASPFILAGAVISGMIVDNLHYHAAGIWAVTCFGFCAILITLSLGVPDDTWKFDESPNRQCSDRRDGDDRQVEKSSLDYSA